MNDKDINAPVAKVVTAFAAAGLTWSEIASILAAIYTVLLMSEWLWKKVGRPLAERWGWVKSRKAYGRRHDDTDLGGLS